jgi:tetratricopeptide (TPR) repeat protein
MAEDILKVSMWEEEVEIPTYPLGAPDKNPMFLEKRVYQGSSGKVYPHPVIDKIYDDKINKKYKAVFLENAYLKIMIFPELGGRIQRAIDKTNNYDFVYYNQVVKPALVGLAGPWISGGIEFNWPQHHRPNTFGPVEYLLQENEDGSKTVWVSEIDRMYGTKGSAGFTLYPDKAYLEIKGQLYNRTPNSQTFLWWANPAVAVNDYTQSVFPPDVHAVFDHGKRDVSKFPIATGTYYKMDYSQGVDISRYKNIPVPTSYMAYRSDYDFVGGYDHGKKAGILHVADHHVSPGKKQWTWGCGDFGKAWDRNLTDEDGPYIELMTGVFTDNQPDFTWLQPYEEKTFKQYFMPYKNIGVVKCANIKGAVSLEVEGGKAQIGVYSTSPINNALVKLEAGGVVYLEERVSLTPAKTFSKVVILKAGEEEHNLKLTFLAEDGSEIVVYQPKEKEVEKVPEPAKAIAAPEDIKNNEALYLAGLHLEQYRHATYEPETYYLEGLKRDSEDIRINNAYGLLLLRRGQFKKSEEYFRQAVNTSIRHNPNPYDSEAYYNLGLSLRYQNRLNEAYDAFFKATWSSPWQDSGFYSLALIATVKRDYSTAMEHVEKSIVRNYHNCKARNLKTALLRKLGKIECAKSFAKETLEIDKTDFGARNELSIIAQIQGSYDSGAVLSVDLKKLMRDDPHNYIALASDYGAAGLYTEAIEILNNLALESKDSSLVYPMIYYYLGYYNLISGNKEQAGIYFDMAEKAKSDYCFPNKLEDLLVLQCAVENNGQAARANYYLGNLWYDKKQYSEAIESWEKSAESDPLFPTVHRNLALAYYNKLKDADKAKVSLERAFELNISDARVFLELDQLYKKLNVPFQERVQFFEEHMGLVSLRDDLYIEYVTLVNLSGEHEKAKNLIASRKFHPWEGGEGKVTKQYVYSRVELAKKYMAECNFEKAVEELQEALIYPENLGEGKLAGAQENDINYYLGCAYEGIGNKDGARDCFIKASVGLNEPSSAMFYNDQPPEMIFYQGLAFMKLGDTAKAKGRFNKLISYGEKHIFDNVTIDYFAVSLPDFLIFDEELNKRNKIHCHYLIGLGNLGLGNREKAMENLKKAEELDVNHQGALTHLNCVYTAIEIE